MQKTMIHRTVHIVLVAATLLAGCSVTGPLERKGANAGIVHVPHRPEPAACDKPGNSYIELRDSGRRSGYLVPVSVDKGERIISLQVPEVVVTAPARTLPERLGRVVIDFVVTIPRTLQGSCRSVTVTPVLHNDGSDRELEGLTIRGGMVSRVQERDYWQYARYRERIRPDSLRDAEAFARFCRFPYSEGARLDSVAETPASVSYYYSQKVNTAQAGKRMLITLRGEVTGLDGSRYRLPPSDTLAYTISSLLSLADTTTRYVQRIIGKYVVVENRSYITFETGRTRIVDTLADNRRELDRIASLTDRIVRQREFLIDSVILTASSSPEGRWSHNAALARGRALALRERLRAQLGDRTPITVRWCAEAWDELGKLIRADSTITRQESVLKLMARYSDPDRREAELRGRYPAEYSYIRRRYYPRLRAVDVSFCLHRAGMVKDTVYTTEVDTAYRRGVALMNGRRYQEALGVLDTYRDRNTAIVLLSLGYDNQAAEVLSALPACAQTEYLSAVALSRLGRRAEAREHYRKACLLNPRMKYRGALDPEISTLHNE